MGREASQQHFSSRLGLLLSVLGIAVGTGNIWRFPRIVAQNSGEAGGGAFLIAWVVCLLTWSLPLIIAEYAMGRKTGRGVVGAFADLGGGGYTWMGAFVAFVATAIMFYYSVVTGWCFYYFSQMLLAPLPTTTEASTQVWESFQAGPWPIVCHALAMGLGALAISRGVKSIERVSLTLLPVLFLIILIAAARALTLPGAGAGIEFLFSTDLSLLGRPAVWLEALTQNAWDTGAGWGLILTYAAWMKKKDTVVKNALITGVGNNFVSLTAALIIFGTVFALLGGTMPRGEVLEIMRSSGPASTGLTFIWMPQLFERMALGRVLAVLFFLGLSFAAFTSLVSMIEMAARVLVDAGVQRRRAVYAVSGVGFLFGIPSALSLDFLSNQDFVWGIGLMISGALIAAVLIRHGVTRFRTAELDSHPDDLSAGRIWDVLLRYAVPFQAAVLLIWWFYLSASAYAPDTWYDPTDPYSVATCVVQWGVVMAVLLLGNRWLYRKAAQGRSAAVELSS